MPKTTSRKPKPSLSVVDGARLSAPAGRAAPEDDHSLVATLERILLAPTVEPAWAILCVEMERFGFDRLLYGFTRFLTETGLGSHEDMMVLSNHVNGYAERYMGEELYRNAPMMMWARQNVGAMSWGWVTQFRDQLTPEQLKVLELNQKYGVTAGYTISFAEASRRSRGAIALTARRGLTQFDVEKIWARHGPEINVLNQVAHLKFSSLPFPHLNKKLSSRQREVLEWVGDGKTTQDIATLMGLKPATVEKHLKKAREALSVGTTAQAVMKASLLNQMFLVEN